MRTPSSRLAAMATSCVTTGPELATVTDTPAEVVALGWDREFTYAKLDAICAARWSGVPILATNPDPTCPLVDGQGPDCGALIAAIETATGWPVDEVVGKPSARMVQLALARYGGALEDCWIVGDRLETDVKMASDCGVRSALVLSGATSAAAAQSAEVKPTMVCDDLNAFATMIVNGAGAASHSNGGERAATARRQAGLQ
jgi:ribonucleotide monophosphatase NagD (HAD superfamily)